MKELHILKEITGESISRLFPHQDDLETVLEALGALGEDEDDVTTEYIPHWMVVILVNNGYLG